MAEGPSRSFMLNALNADSSYQPGNNHLLLIGIDAYADKRIPDLKNARLDAEALSKLLCEQYAFDGEVIQLFDEDATRARIYEALDHFTDKLTEEDNLLIFFSGHGYYRQNQNRGYLVSADTKIGAFHTFISNTVLLEDYLPNIPARHVVLIVDSCFSGSLFKNISPNTGQYSDQTLRKMMEKRSRHGIAAGSIELVSDGLTGKHSPFAKSLLNQLKTNEQSHLPILDLFHPVSQETTYSANQRPVYGVLAKSQHIPGAQFVLSRRRNQAQDYHIAEQANTAQAWTTFLQAYPDSSQKTEIETRITALQEQEAWAEAKKRNTITAFRSYRQQFPDGAHRSDALDNMEQLEADRDWPETQQQHTISGYERFLESHPRCQQLPEAKAAIEGLLAAEQKAANKRSKPLAAAAGLPQQQAAVPQRRYALDWRIPAGVFTLALLIALGFWAAKDKESVQDPVPDNPVTIVDPFDSTMVLINGGTFTMGSNEEEDAKPHQVTLSDFYIGKYEVTQAEWKAVMDTNPSRFTNCDQCPVEAVSWEDIQLFIDKLDIQTGQTYRLPTEAEWEYAAGGGASHRTKYVGTNDEDSLGNYAWYSANADIRTHPVGEKYPNSLGLYDMGGNLSEWCHDWSDENYFNSAPDSLPEEQLLEEQLSNPPRVIRGGGFAANPQHLRVAYPALLFSPVSRSPFIGFRLAKTP